jgi:hypothetical protein
MRSAFALGLVALFACGGDSTTAPETGAIALSKKTISTELPSASDPTVHTEFVCGPSYPTDGGVAPGWCTELVKLLWLQPLGTHTWYVAWETGGEAPGDTLIFTYGPYRSPKPIIRHDGIYQFDAINVTVEGHRRYMEVSVQNSQPVNWGIFTK